MNTTTVQYKVVFVQKDEDSDNKNSKRVNSEGEEQYHHYGKKDWQLINDWPDISPEKRDHIKKYSVEWWAKNNGHNHIQVG